MTIKHLVLDVGGVLAHPGGISKDAEDCMSDKGIDLRQAGLLRSKYDHKLNLGEEKFSTFIEEYNENTGHDFTVDEFQEIVFSCISFNHKLIDFCKGLEDVEVSVCSDNFRRNVIWLNKTIDLDEWTEEQVYSYNYGVTKRKKKLYKEVLKKLDADAEECVLVDDFPKNVEMAEKVGMEGILFENNDQLFQELEELNLT